MPRLPFPIRGGFRLGLKRRRLQAWEPQAAPWAVSPVVSSQRSWGFSSWYPLGWGGFSACPFLLCGPGRSSLGSSGLISPSPGG